DLDPEPSVDQRRARSLYLDLARRAVQRGVAERPRAFRGDAVLGGAHAHAVGTPGLNTDHLVPVPHLEGAVVVVIAHHAGLVHPRVGWAARCPRRPSE